MMDDISEIRIDVRELRQRTTVLTWAVGILAGLTIAILGNLVVQSYQLGQTIGRLDVLIDHVQMK
jgi:hypothetical protein